MTRQLSGTVEAFPCTDLTDYYESIGARFARQVGTHAQWALPNGVTLPAPSATIVTSRLMRMAAHKLGMTYPELRAAVGHPIVKSGKVSKGTVAKQAERPKVSKGDALRACDDLIAAAQGIRREVQQGIRDGEFYRDRFGVCNRALKAMGVAS